MPETVDTFFSLEFSVLLDSMFDSLTIFSATFILVQGLWENKIILGPINRILLNHWLLEAKWIITVQMLNWVQHNSPCNKAAIYFRITQIMIDLK